MCILEINPNTNIQIPSLYIVMIYQTVQDIICINRPDRLDKKEYTLIKLTHFFFYLV